ncbi:hypothetical protein AAFF_G00226390 [Aldrovandia affinis]|uniref:Uncharacterized protein n=1 Tax=Aldrovandia affinis TaxID=143900 RepID=A0AAD7TB93_9TELE|nr:hypothetical protein AAFF_G00226390 [Aldrovandia affinis]
MVIRWGVAKSQHSHIPLRLPVITRHSCAQALRHLLLYRKSAVSHNAREGGAFQKRTPPAPKNTTTLPPLASLTNSTQPPALNLPPGFLCQEPAVTAGNAVFPFPPDTRGDSCPSASSRAVFHASAPGAAVPQMPLAGGKGEGLHYVPFGAHDMQAVKIVKVPACFPVPPPPPNPPQPQPHVCLPV